MVSDQCHPHRPWPPGTGEAADVWLAHYRPDGSVGMASTIEGTTGAGPDEIDPVGDRVYLDLVARGSGTAGAGTRIEADDPAVGLHERSATVERRRWATRSG